MDEAVNEQKLQYLEHLHRETSDRHHTDTEDAYQYDLLRMGDPRAVDEGIKMFASNLPGHISDDPLRNYKYLFVASATLASRSAIAGGMDAAQNMLQFTDYTYAEIAAILAFSSQSHFIRTFRSQTGYTPKAFRNQFFRTPGKIAP